MTINVLELFESLLEMRTQEFSPRQGIEPKISSHKSQQTNFCVFFYPEPNIIIKEVCFYSFQKVIYKYQDYFLFYSCYHYSSTTDFGELTQRIVEALIFKIKKSCNLQKE